MYRNTELETVNQFKYLGFVLGSSGKFSKGIQSLASQGERAVFSLKRILHRYPEMMPETQIKLFRSLVSPVLAYSSEIWGFCEADQIEKVHLAFMKNVLGVKKNNTILFCV